MNHMLSSFIREMYFDSVYCEFFNISTVRQTACSNVTKDMIQVEVDLRLCRYSIVMHEGKLRTLIRFKDDDKKRL